MHRLLIALLIVASAAATRADEGIFYDPARVGAMRALFATDPTFAGLKTELEGIDRESEREFLRTEVRYNDHLYDIARIGNLAQQMALLYVFSGDQDAAALARECVETLMKFPRWDYFLEGGTRVFGLQRAPNSALAVALASEALGDLVSAEDRHRWMEVLAERGIEPCWLAVHGMRYPDSVKGWGFDPTSTYLEHRPADRGLDLSRWPIILNTINLKAIPASVLALSALTYRKHMGETEATERWIEQAIYSISTFRGIYAQDGSYNEGVSYANYTTIHLIQAVDALKRTGVADMTDLLNWPGYVRYLLAMMMPTRTDPYAIVNFSDAGGGATSAAPFWIARETRDGLAQWFGLHMGRERDVWSLLWYDGSVEPEPPLDRPHLWHSDLDWIVGRTGFDLEDLMVAMRSGPPYNHEHADRNSIVLTCYGERLVADPMRPPYSFADPAWVMRLTSGHSALLIDGQGHQYVDGKEGTNASQAHAAIVRSGERQDHLFWTSDATQAYRLVIPDVRSVTRTVIMLTEVPAVVLVDKVVKSLTPSTIQARFFGQNQDGNCTVIAEESGFTILRPAALLGGYSASARGVAFASRLLPIPEETARLHPFAEVSTADPALETCLVTVLLPFEKEAGAGSIQMKRENGVTRAAIGDQTRTIEVLVHESGAIPAFEIR